ncbi:MAG: hypothetical protein H0W36_09400 [Gemmatimonadetes bacterium]|nr:hypothetical protein [Gemmatimonadota bacterium]
MRSASTSFRCANCDRQPRADENAEDEWRAGSDGLGELHVFCPECWEREFGKPGLIPKVVSVARFAASARLCSS